LGDAICNLRASQGDAVYREFYYNDAGVQIQTLARSANAFQGPEAGRRRLAERRKGCGLQRRLYRRHCRGLQGKEDREIGRPRGHR
jgi:arginyl-tRNA synthetase